MTRVFSSAMLGKQPTCRVFLLGVSAYPHARKAFGFPSLPDISSASISAIALAHHMLEWSERLALPLGSIDLLCNSTQRPQGEVFHGPAGDVRVEAPTMAAIRKARDRWLEGATAEDMVVFYCCGHGSWLPEQSRMLFAADWGEDRENPWNGTISLDGFALGLAEKMPRLQWLIFDTCAAPEAGMTEAVQITVDPLIASRAGQKAATAGRQGPLSRTIVAPSIGSTAVGRPGEISRLLTMLIEACSGSGITSTEDGTWWVDHESLARALRTYADRVAAPVDEKFFRFPLDVASDSVGTPRLMQALRAPECTIIVEGHPADHLAGQAITISDSRQNQLARRDAGPGALATYRATLPAWDRVGIDVHFATGTERQDHFTLPPLVRSTFKRSK